MVLAAEADQLDAVADQVQIRVDAEVIESCAARETAGRGGAVDNLIGRGDDAESGGEFEGAVLASAVAVTILGWWVVGEFFARISWVLDAFPAARRGRVVCWESRDSCRQEGDCTRKNSGRLHLERELGGFRLEWVGLNIWTRKCAEMAEELGMKWYRSFTNGIDKRIAGAGCLLCLIHLDYTWDGPRPT